MKKFVTNLVKPSGNSQSKSSLFKMAMSNPCVQYKSTKFGFGTHFEEKDSESIQNKTNQSKLDL